MKKEELMKKYKGTRAEKYIILDDLTATMIMLEDETDNLLQELYSDIDKILNKE